ncbi:MerR HTH family regulatory protein [Thermomonospora echinospora]|uniref:MerR HTH family regulatory protein n=1 Tax=Thermomonospora echinospora TaxID=1992 RepID=A0A1H5VFF4_9ACTN|nr:MerR family transcriptional regulator [Thermomonospora echinospora]SEF85776.1 MerR HTH family regulatory protein [Thermomonospora echinospora]
MTLAELSAVTGVPIPTIEKYLRHGLLPPGEPDCGAAPARYGAAHVDRLRLVRAMLEVGGLSIDEAHAVLRHLDAGDRSMHTILGMVTGGCVPPAADGGDQPWQDADQEVARLVTGRHWRVGPGSPAWRLLAQTIVVCRWLGQDDLLTRLADYAHTAEQMAATDLTLVAARAERDSVVEGALVWTVLGEMLIAAIRRMALEDASARLFAADQEG